MLERADLEEEKIIACLQDDYGLLIKEVAFLPLGADRDTAVYRLIAADETPYFLKLRKGVFDETSVALPQFLSSLGITQIIPPLTTKSGRLWGNLDTFKTILYPYIEGHNGYEADLFDHHWRDLGTALKRIHTADVPMALISRIRQESYSPYGRDTVKRFLARIEHKKYDDPTAVQLAAYLQTKRAEILDLVDRAEQHARRLHAQTPDLIVCHSDLHAGNILLGTNGALYIVDWDEPILAPKERDLMAIGGALMASGLTAQEEEALFYETYGPTQLNLVALAYYRYERIIQDIAEFCEQLFLTDEGSEDRQQALYYLQSNFLPNGTIEAAYQADMATARPYK